ncbi:hypothetical protein Riv7116_3218 [Rivularia sp. PCC 7116]|uniref:hypothetical protein n=1 Tax=Rivularia sp. PCC 7116 TaxID=373994 RepID=UPI00029EEA14|nr:hypothetical protein [Rivularia sp. PCC 7116]AFY55689.1 hypothetical protein Riv7116_3218 [Rivularia sp. PCC 7116]
MKNQLLKNMAIAVVVVIGILPAAQAQQRNSVAHPRTPYRLSFYNRHRRSYRVASALHFAHSKLHDVLLLTAFENHAAEDKKLYKQVINFYKKPPRIEPTMELYAPYTARATWQLFRTIDSIHLLHEMTEDVMSDKDIAWNQKGKALKEAYEIYKNKYKNIAFSPAPLDVTMRRAGVMMKPYFTLTRNYYPQNNNFFYAAHWWHPAVYESMMIGGNDKEQDAMIQKMEDVFQNQVVPNPPMRMLLSREGAPRYSRLSPETANVFDNLHMLHGITYDIFAYEGWTIKQKRAELYRVLKALSYQPGDEKLVRKFNVPKPNFNPLVYDEWAKSSNGAMTRMMMEMAMEMMPMMHGNMNQEMHQKIMAQLKMKLTPGIQEGEIPGSWIDAMKVLMPNMKMSPEAMQPGKINPMMVNIMLDGWREKYGSLPDIEPISMDIEPSAKNILSSRKLRINKIAEQRD